MTTIVKRLVKSARQLSVPVVGLSLLCAGAGASAHDPGSPAYPNLASAPAVHSEAQSVALWLGGDVGPSSYAFFTGGRWAVNGDLSKDGFLLQLGGAAGEYDGGIVSAENAHVGFQNVNALVGYQHNFQSGRAALFVGPDYTHNGKNAFPDVRGDAWGVRVIGDVVTSVSPDFDLSGWGTYTTIQNNYLIQGRGLYRASNHLRIGPEIAFAGGDTWHQNRAGAHAGIAFRGGELGVSFGHTWGSASGIHEGFYGNAIISASF